MQGVGDQLHCSTVISIQAVSGHPNVAIMPSVQRKLHQENQGRITLSMALPPLVSCDESFDWN
jgi:hypothetical protein